MSALNDYLIEKRVALRAHRSRVEAGEVGPKQVVSRITAVGRSGVRKTTIRSHNLLMDSGPETGGFDLGPTPVELLLTSLGGCMAHVFMVQASLRGIALDGLDVTVTADSDPRGGSPAHPDIPAHPTNIAFEIAVVSPASDEELEALFSASERNCPVTALLTQAQPVTGSLRVTRPA